MAQKLLEEAVERAEAGDQHGADQCVKAAAEVVDEELLEQMRTDNFIGG